MEKILEIVTVLVIVGAALAFGGVHPITYSLVEVALFLALLVLMARELFHGRGRFQVLIWPVLFVLWVALQLVPLPAGLVQHLSPARVASAGLALLPPGSHAGTLALSINSHDTMVALLKFLAYFSAFLLAAHLFDSRQHKSTLIRGLIILGCFEAGYGIVQYLTGWHKIFTYTNVHDLLDATGTYINRNHFAGLLELILPFVLASAFYSLQKGSGVSRPDGRRAPSQPSARYQALFYLFLLSIMSVALVFSRSRGGIIAATFSLIFIALLGQLRIRRKGWMLSVVFFLTLIIGYGFWIGLNPVLFRFEKMGQRNFLQMEGRVQIWQDTLELVREYPLTGTGLGTFPTAYRRYQTGSLDKFVNHAHNDYLEFTSDTGLPGVALLFLPILYLFIRMIVSFLNDSHRYRRSILLGCIGSTLALLIHSTMDFNLQMPANALVFAVVLGIGYKIACRESQHDSTRRAFE